MQSKTLTNTFRKLKVNLAEISGKTKKYSPERTQTTKNNSRHYCAATTTIWLATNLDPWRNELPK